MTSEIGGIFDLDSQASFRLEGSCLELAILQEGDLLCMSGRTALALILSRINADLDRRKTRGARVAYLPSYCCQSMIDPFIRAGFNLEFYPVYLSAQGAIKPNIELRNHCDVFLATSYFGDEESAMDPWIMAFQELGVIVVEDVTHRLLSSPLGAGAEYTFGSLRKWLGIPTGAFARYRDGTMTASLRDPREACDIGELAMHLKSLLVRGLGDENLRSELLSLQRRQALLIAKDYEARSMDNRSAAVVLDTDFSLIRARRRANAEILIDGIAAHVPAVQVPMSFDPLRDAPLFVPILVSATRRRRILDHMHAKGIFLPVHWPKPGLIGPDPRVDELYDREISVVCDQRYSAEDMDTVVASLQEATC